MSTYNHTIYENYSQSQLTSLFSSEKWQSLSFSERMDACQEVENRYAAVNNVHPCTVTHEPMNGACYGWQSGRTICLNSYLVADGQFSTQYTDQNGNIQTVRTDALAPGWNTLDTVYHEGTHGIQEQTGKMPSTYINPEMDGDLYRIQGVEKEAYAIGQMKTLEAISNHEKNVGHLDAGRNDYITSVRNDSFQAALAEAARNYNDPNIEQTLQTVINDRENNIIRENPSASYIAISSLCDSYDIHASKDVTQGATSSLTADSSLTNSSSGLSSTEETSTSLNDGMEENHQGAAFSDSLQDGSEEIDNYSSVSSESLDDGIDSDIHLNESISEGLDDGMEENYQDTSSPNIDDGYSDSTDVVDYGSSEQSYSDDGSSIDTSYDSGSSGSNGIENSD